MWVIVFRRTLIFVLIAVLLGTLLGAAFLQRSKSYGSNIWGLTYFGCFLSIMAWSSIFLKKEPDLTRLALIVDLTSFVGALALAWVAANGWHM
jgi:hypothetical protein